MSTNLLRLYTISSFRSIKILNRSNPNTVPWGTSFVSSHRLRLAINTPFTKTLRAWPSNRFVIQQKVHLSKPLAASVSRRMRGERMSKVCFTYVRVDNIPSLSLIHQAGHPFIKGDQVSQAGPAFHKLMLVGPDSMVVLYVPYDGT